MKLKQTILAAFIATSATAFGLAAQAQQPGAGCDGSGPKGMQGGPGMMRGAVQSMGDPAAMAEQRLARIKSELKLTAQQESLWQSYADKIKTQAGQGRKAMQEKMGDASLSAPDRMAAMMNSMKERMAAMQSANESFKTFYDALSAEQKAIADKQAASFGHMGSGMRPGPDGKGAPGRGAPQSDAGNGHRHG